VSAPKEKGQRQQPTPFIQQCSFISRVLLLATSWAVLYVQVRILIADVFAPVPAVKPKHPGRNISENLLLDNHGQISGVGEIGRSRNEGSGHHNTVCAGRRTRTSRTSVAATSTATPTKQCTGDGEERD
jgi:hypothetical protein